MCRLVALQLGEYDSPAGSLSEPEPSYWSVLHPILHIRDACSVIALWVRRMGTLNGVMVSVLGRLVALRLGKLDRHVCPSSEPEQADW